MDLAIESCSHHFTHRNQSDIDQDHGSIALAAFMAPSPTRSIIAIQAGFFCGVSAPKTPSNTGIAILVTNYAGSRNSYVVHTNASWYVSNY